MTRESEIPDGWKEVRLEEIAREKRQRADGVPGAEVFSVTKHKGFVRSLDYFDRQVFSRDTSNYKVVHHGDLAYATIHLDEGSIGRLSDADVGLISPMYTVFEVERSKADSRFLFSLMKLPQMVAWYQRIGEGSIHRRKSISFERLGRLTFALPTIEEQLQIMEVLEAIDEAIESAEAVIAATEQVRDSLLHELLTRGMPGWHTEWREVPGIGTIPAPWEVVRLGDVARLGAGKKPIYKNNGGTVKVLGANGPIGLTDKSNFSDGIAVGRVGASGSVHRVLEPTWLSDNVLFVDPDSDVWDVTYLYNALRKANLSKLASVTAQPLLTQSELNAVKLPLPRLSEQHAMARLMDVVDDSIANQKSELALIQLFKKSTADALLTGRSRIGKENDPSNATSK